MLSELDSLVLLLDGNMRLSVISDVDRVIPYPCSLSPC
jgi:hypothetical protein